jgi:hypothetical protein
MRLQEPLFYSAQKRDISVKPQNMTSRFSFWATRNALQRVSIKKLFFSVSFFVQRDKTLALAHLRLDQFGALEFEIAQNGQFDG